MTYRQYDSTKTRVTPVFDIISKTENSWLRRLLKLPMHGASPVDLEESADLTVDDAYWGDKEKAIDPPLSLLYWVNQQPSRWSE